MKEERVLNAGGDIMTSQVTGSVSLIQVDLDALSH